MRKKEPRRARNERVRALSVDSRGSRTSRGGVSVRMRRAYLSGSVSLTRGRGGVASLRLAAPRSGVARERVPRWRGRAEPQPPRVPGARKHNPTGTRDARERALGARGGARDAHNAARGLTAALAAVERGLKRPRGVRHRERAGESRHGRSGSGGRVLSPVAFARRPVACAPLVSVARVRARGRTSAASACDELPLGAAAQPSSDARRGFTPGLRNRRDWTLIFWIAFTRSSARRSDEAARGTDERPDEVSLSFTFKGTPRSAPIFPAFPYASLRARASPAIGSSTQRAAVQNAAAPTCELRGRGCHACAHRVGRRKAAIASRRGAFRREGPRRSKSRKAASRSAWE